MVCEHPKYIYNKYLGEKIVCACGRCPACQNLRSDAWVSRLEAERAKSLYSFFMYVDFDEQHVPRLVYRPSLFGDYLVDPDDMSVRVPISELPIHSKADADYLYDRLSRKGFIPYFPYAYLQNLNKRINKALRDKYTFEYANFRFSWAQEYGPTTFRPHAHGIFFTDNPKVAEVLRDVLASCWASNVVFRYRKRVFNTSTRRWRTEKRILQERTSFGHTDAKYVESSACSYVAGYICAYTRLPSIYWHPALRPRFTASRRPIVGGNKYTDEEVLELFDSRNPLQLQYRAGSPSLVVGRVPNSLENKIFPKVCGFHSLTHVGLSSILRRLSGKCFAGFKEFAEYLDVTVFPVPDIDDLRKAFNPADEYELEDHFWLLPSSTSDTFFDRFVLYHTENKRKTKSFYRNLWRLYRAWKFAFVFENCSIDDYVRRYFDYHKRKDYENLKEMYEYEQEYVKHNPVQDLVWLYTSSCMAHFDGHSLSPAALSSFGLARLDWYAGKKFYLDYVAQQHRKLDETTKSQMKSVYKESVLKYRDFDLYNIITNFYANKHFSEYEAVSRPSEKRFRPQPSRPVQLSCW